MSASSIKDQFLGILRSDVDFTDADLGPVFDKYDSGKNGTLTINEIEGFFETVFGMTNEAASNVAGVILANYDGWDGKTESRADFSISPGELRACLNDNKGYFLNQL